MTEITKENPCGSELIQAPSSSHHSTGKHSMQYPINTP